MDALATAAVERARAALEMARGPTDDKPQAFAQVAKAFAAHGEGQAFFAALEHAPPSARRFVEKATGATVSSLWDEAVGRGIADAFLASIRPRSLLELIATHAKPVPASLASVRVLSGLSGTSADEGAPKVAETLTVDAASMTARKPCAVVVMAKETLREESPAAVALFTGELESATIRCGNEAVLGLLTPTLTLGASGDVLADLAQAIEAAGPSEHYLIAASRSVAAALALRSEGRIGPQGGEFLPGVHVIAVDHVASPTPRMIVVAAESLAVRADPLRLARSEHGTVELAASTQDAATGAGAQQVSLWQTNAAALLAERPFALAVAGNVIEVA